MSIYAKLNKARKQFHEMPLKKTGWNSYAEYWYFQLSDFLVPAIEVFNENGLCAVVSFESELATMRIVDIETGENFTITSPMGSAKLKACHEVQNIGAVETYQRRYLWVAALEILENDILDSKKASKDTEDEKPATKASPEQEASIVEWIESTGTDKDKLLLAYNVSSLSELTAVQASDAIAKLKAKKVKAVA